ncbi:MAG: TIGR01777 family oxidoreductase [Planctomycetota bacterium]
MKIILPGGSGQIGGVLARHFAGAGHDVVILSRSQPSEVSHSGRIVGWDGAAIGPWAEELEGADAVINLAGKSVNCRYHEANRAKIYSSRLDSTRVLGEAITACENPPRVWLNSSTATIYPHTPEPPAKTETDPIGCGTDKPDTWQFSFDVANRWEEAAVAFRSQLPDTRLVLLRSAMVMSPDRGGVFSVLRNLVKARLGGRVGGGEQYMSWIHDADFCMAIDRLIADDSLSGPVNLAAPHPLTQADFMAALRDACGVTLGVQATAWMLELAAFFLRTESELLLKSRCVVPAKLTDAGFAFQFPEWPEAARDLAARFQ